MVIVTSSYTAVSVAITGNLYHTLPKIQADPQQRWLQMRKRSRVSRTSTASIWLVEKTLKWLQITKELVDAIRASGTSAIQDKLLQQIAAVWILMISYGLLIGHVAEAHGNPRVVCRLTTEVDSLMSTKRTQGSTHGPTGALRFISRKLVHLLGRRSSKINISTMTSHSPKSTKWSLRMKDLQG